MDMGSKAQLKYEIDPKQIVLDTIQRDVSILL